MSDLAAALMIAIRTHADQRDKQGAPYLLHVLRVVEAVGDDAKVVAALHDVFEDSDHGLDDATVQTAGLSRDEAVGIALLTRQPDETYAEYIQFMADNVKLRGGTIACEVKLADLRDNLGRIPAECDPKRTPMEAALTAPLKARYEKAIAILEGAS